MSEPTCPRYPEGCLHCSQDARHAGCYQFCDVTEYDGLWYAHDSNGVITHVHTDKPAIPPSDLDCLTTHHPQ
jgi:hypothetical protein